MEVCTHDTAVPIVSVNGPRGNLVTLGAGGERRATHDLLDNLGRRLDVDEALVDLHLELQSWNEYGSAWVVIGGREGGGRESGRNRAGAGRNSRGPRSWIPHRKAASMNDVCVCVRVCQFTMLRE